MIDKRINEALAAETTRGHNHVWFQDLAVRMVDILRNKYYDETEKSNN